MERTVRAESDRWGRHVYTDALPGMEPFTTISVTSFLGGWPQSFDEVAALRVAEEAVEHHAQLAGLIERDGAESVTKWLQGANKRKLNVASGRGTDVHAMFESIMFGKEPLVTEAAAPYLVQLRDAVDKLGLAPARAKLVCPAPQFLEVSVFNRRDSYAGMLDVIAEIPALEAMLDGLPAVVDLKTRGPGKASTIYAKEVAQLAAYRNAEYAILYGQRVALPKMSTHAFILAIAPDEWFLHPVDAGDAAMGRFMLAKAMYDIKGKNDLIGKPLRPAAGDAGKMIEKPRRPRAAAKPKAVPVARPEEAAPEPPAALAVPVSALEPAADATDERLVAWLEAREEVCMPDPVHRSRLDWLATRLANIRANPDAARLAQAHREATTLPPFSRAGFYSNDELGQAISICQMVEDFLAFPFAEPDPLWRWLPSSLDHVKPDEGPRLSTNDINAFRARIGRLHPEHQAFMSAVSAQARDAGRPISTADRPSVRRFEIGRSLIWWLPYGSDLYRSALAMVYGTDVPTTQTLGWAVGGLAIPQARSLVELAEQLASGQLALFFDDAGYPRFRAAEPLPV